MCIRAGLLRRPATSREQTPLNPHAARGASFPNRRPPAGALIARTAVVLTAVSLASSCSDASNHDYFPLEPGFNWEYAVHSKTMLFESHAKYIVDNIGPASHGNTRAVAQKVQGGNIYYYRIEPGGIHRIGIRRAEGSTLTDSSRDLLVLPSAIKVGARWTQATVTGVLQTEVDPFRRIYNLRATVPMTYTVESVEDTVTVPAGRFAHCLKVRGEGNVHVRPDKTLGRLSVHVENTDWYAPGVGLVRTVRHETTDSHWLAEGRYTLELLRFARD